MTTSSASLILPSATWSSPSWGSEWRDPSPQWSYQPSRSRRGWMICGLKDLIKKSGPAGPSPSCRRQACQIPWCLCVSIYLESIQCVVIYINKIVREWNNQSLSLSSPPLVSSSCLCWTYSWEVPVVKLKWFLKNHYITWDISLPSSFLNIAFSHSLRIWRN